MGYFGKLRDKPPVVRSQFCELALLLQEDGNRKFLHGSDMQRGWLQSCQAGGHQEPQVLYFSSSEMTLARLQFESCLHEIAYHLAKVLEVVFQ